MTEKEKERINAQKLERLPKLLKLTRNKNNVLFLNEAVFTTRSIIKRVWASQAESAKVFKSNYRFEAVGVAAAIDLKGRLVAYVTAPNSINLMNLKYLR